jgi:succinyl-CoA:acetate CoA-transferase
VEDLTDRIKCKKLLNVISNPSDVVKGVLPRKGTIAWGGLGQMSTPKVIPAFIAKYVEESGEKFELNVYTSGSAASELDDSLIKANAVKRRYIFQNNPKIREKINKGFVHYQDIWLGEFGRQLKYGFLDDLCGPMDAVVVEAVGIEKDGSIIPALSVDNMPLFVQLARKVIVEVNMLRPHGTQWYT